MDIESLAREALEQDAKATPGPWIDMRAAYRERMKAYKKATGKWWHGTERDGCPVELIAQDNFQGDPIKVEDIPTRCDYWDLHKVLAWRWDVVSKKRTDIIEGWFSDPDRAWLIAARTREPALAREVLRLRAWLLDITDAIPGGWPPGTEPPA